MEFWPWWLGAAALAVVAIGYWLALGRLLGVSGSLATSLAFRTARENDRQAAAMAADPEGVAREMIAATQRAFGFDPVLQAGATASPTRSAFPWSAHVTLLIGLVAGGAIGGLVNGRFAVSAALPVEFERLLASGAPGYALLLLGGALVGFGTTMAGGCTSGHGLCGTSRLQRGSLLATVCFFGAAVVVSLVLEAVQQ